MNIRVYSILDVKAQLFGQLFQAPTDVHAKRSFDRLKADTNSQIYYYPEDFVLYYVADFNDATGIITQKSIPELIATSAQETSAA